MRSSWGNSNLQQVVWPSSNPAACQCSEKLWRNFSSRFWPKTSIFALYLNQHLSRRPQRSKILQKENASVCLLFCGRSVLNHSRLGRGWLSEARSQFLTTLLKPLLVLAWFSYWHRAAVFLSSGRKLQWVNQRVWSSYLWNQRKIFFLGQMANSVFIWVSAVPLSFEIIFSGTRSSYAAT